MVIARQVRAPRTLARIAGYLPNNFVVKTLEKMRESFSRLEISLEADRHSPEPRYITAVRAKFDFWSDGLNPDKVKRAIGLSIAKYCSVYHSLRADLEVRVEYRIHDSAKATRA